MTDERTPDEAPETGADPAEASSVVAPAGPESGADWRDGLPAPLRRVAEKFPTPEEAVRSYAALERRLGRSVTLPEPDAGPEEIAAFHARMGRPDTPDGYPIETPADLPDHLRPGPADAPARSAFLAAMHGAGATPAAVQAAFDWYFGAAAEADAAARHAREEAEAALRRDWGAAFERNVALARRAERSFADDELVAAVEKAGLADHPAWLRALARIGRATQEDALLTGGESAPADDARRRIDAIMAEHFGKPSYGDAAVQSELRGLYATLYGSGDG